VSEEHDGTGQENVDTAAEPAAAGGAAGLLDLVSDVPVTLTVEIGSSRMLLREVLQLDAGSVVELDRESGELADVLVNGRLVARGDVTVVDERLAVRIVEVVRGR
jgi:flagellar motor switch protein FliN/FliY